MSPILKYGVIVEFKKNIESLVNTITVGLKGTVLWVFQSYETKYIGLLDPERLQVSLGQVTMPQSCVEREVLNWQPSDELTCLYFVWWNAITQAHMWYFCKCSGHCGNLPNEVLLLIFLLNGAPCPPFSVPLSATFFLPHTGCQAALTMNQSFGDSLTADGVKWLGCMASSLCPQAPLL